MHLCVQTSELSIWLPLSNRAAIEEYARRPRRRFSSERLPVTHHRCGLWEPFSFVPSPAQWISLEMAGTEEAKSRFQIYVTLQAMPVPVVE